MSGEYIRISLVITGHLFTTLLALKHKTDKEGKLRNPAHQVYLAAEAGRHAE
jgi:hypothetical protein